MTEKVVRFSYNNEIKYGEVTDEKIISESLEMHINEVDILPPTDPSKVICVGLNHKDHANELNQELPSSPMFFYKPPSAVIGNNDSINLPEVSDRVDYEAEMAIVIGEKCKKVDKDEVDDFIWGYTCLNDVTARDIQEKEEQWVISKGFDSFCPIGPYIANELPENPEVKCVKNEEIKQKSSLENLIFDEKELVSYLSNHMTLNKGDIISTGTPSGVGELNHGDTVEVRVDGIGTLRNNVVKE